MYLLDTNTLIYFFKQQSQVAAHLKNIAVSQVAIASVVLFELEYGVLRSSRLEIQRKGIDAAMSVYGVLSLDDKAARSAAWLNYTMEAAGTLIGHFDQLIAGIVLVHDMILVTRNTREFERVPGLRVENWHD